MKVQIIEKGGQPEFAVVPFEDYQMLLQRLRKTWKTPGSSGIPCQSRRIIPGGIRGPPPQGEKPDPGCGGNTGGVDTGRTRGKVVSVAHISQIESGKRDCSVKLLRALSDTGGGYRVALQPGISRVRAKAPEGCGEGA